MLKYFSVMCMFLHIFSYGQNIAINNDGSSPNPYAILDIRSNSKGILIPRLDSNSRKALPNIRGLLLYDSTTNSFWYNTGTSWKDLSVSGSEWMITGNSGLSASNFMGTKDNVPLTIRVNNLFSGNINQNNFNTFWGYNAGNGGASNSNTGVGFMSLSMNQGSANTGVGVGTLRVNTSGYNNTAIGYAALGSNITGGNNTSVGYQSLDLSTSGMNNTSVGHQSLLQNISGNQNTSLGLQALYSNNNGSNNTAAGVESLWQNISGGNNVALGLRSQYNNRTGNNNNSSGYFSLSNNTSGSNNTAVGAFALNSNSTGNSNTAIGFQADVLSSALENATAIGASATVNASNKVRIGNSTVTVIEGQVPFTTPSDGRYKYNLRDDVKGLDFILRLHPVSYNFDTKRFDLSNVSNMHQVASREENKYEASSMVRRSGFIAQEVEQAAIQAEYNFSGINKPASEKEHYGLSYETFVVPLVKAVQEQQALIVKQQKSIEELELRIRKLEEKIATIMKQFKL